MYIYKEELDESIEMRDSQTENASDEDFFPQKREQKWSESYTDKYNQIVLKELTSSFVEIIKAQYGPKSENVWEDILDKKIVENQLIDGSQSDKKVNIQINEIQKNYSELIESYNSAQNFRLKKMYLSMISDKYTESALIQVFHCTEWQLRMAKTHAKVNGHGAEIVKNPVFRDYLDEETVYLFLLFITSDSYLQTSAYGLRKYKINQQVSLVSADAIRLATEKQIFMDYKNHCITEGLSYLSERTVYRILNKCSATKLRTLQGLDNIKTEGVRGIQNVEKIINSLSKSSNKPEVIEANKILVENLKACENHLNFTFKSNLSFSNECSDHCVTHALSDINDLGCKHDHKRSCDECNTLEFIIEQISDQIKFSNLDEKQKKNLSYDLNQEKEKIFEWKFHLSRNWAQDEIKYETLKNLKEGNCWIIFDWAQKILQQRFRETQKEYFAKKGMSMHVTCVVFKQNGIILTLTFVHLFEACTQDLNAVIGVLDHVLKEIFTLLGPMVNLIFIYNC
jgi:hypothetical protein